MSAHNRRVTRVQNALRTLPEKRKRKLCETLCSTKLLLERMMLKTWGRYRYTSTRHTNPTLCFKLEARRHLCSLSHPLLSGWLASAVASLCCYPALRLWLPLAYTWWMLLSAPLGPLCSSLHALWSFPAWLHSGPAWFHSGPAWLHSGPPRVLRPCCALVLWSSSNN